MKKKRQPRRRMGWIAFGLGMIALRVAMEWAPLVAETLYGRGVFQVVRFVLDHTLGLLPFPAVYLLLILLFVWGIYKWRRRRLEERNLMQRLESGVVSVLAVGFGTVGLFLFMWGFNYARIPLRHQLELNIRSLDARDLTVELGRTAEGLNRLAGELPEEPSTDRDARVLEAVKGVLDECGWPAPGGVRVRTFRPGGWIMSFGISGIYNPFTGAATLPSGVPAVSRPFLAAHETAHAYGITDEGEANLVAFLACTRGHDPELAYSGHLALWGYLAGPVSRHDPSGYEKIVRSLSPHAVADLRSISEHWRKYRGALMRAAHQVNDAYLRSQGVRAGVRSYAGFPALLRAWRLRLSGK